MLKRIDLGHENVLAFRWEGKFDNAAFENAMTQFLPELKLRDRFNVYIEVSAIEGMEANAIWKDLKFYFKNRKELGEKIEKVALVNDQKWMKELAELSYTFIPDIKLKTFSMIDREKAIYWVTDQAHVL